MDLMMMERVGDRWEKMEGSCSTGQRPQWAVVPVKLLLLLLLLLLHMFSCKVPVTLLRFNEILNFLYRY
jgi:uncharacterized integral membrane protein